MRVTHIVIKPGYCSHFRALLQGWPLARRPRFRTSAAANLLSQVEYAKPDILRRMAMNAQQLARSLDADQLVSESWLIEKVTGVRSRGADTTESLVGSAVIDDLAALCIRLTDRAPIDATRADGGAFALQDVANKLGVGVRSIQRWRRLGFVSMRFQFGRTCRVGCDGATMKWFEMRHPEMLSKVKRPAPTQQDRQRLLARARVVAASGGTLNAAAVTLARAEKISVAVARRALEHLEKTSHISPLKRRIIVDDTKAAVAWRSWLRGVDLNAIARRVGQTRTGVLRTIAKQRQRRIQECLVRVVPMTTFERVDAEQTLLAASEVREHLAYEPWPTQPQKFLTMFAPVLHARTNAQTTDRLQLAALRFLLWRVAQQVSNVKARGLRTSSTISVSPTSASKWGDLDRCETKLRWAARIRLSLLQRAVGEALGRLQAIAGAPLHSLHEARMCQAIEIALDSVCAVLDQVMMSAPSARAIRLGSLAAAHAEKIAVKHWEFRARPAPHEPTVLPEDLQLRCVSWLPIAPLRDDVSRVISPPSLGRELLCLKYGWQGRAPHTITEAANILSIHPRRAAIICAETFRALVQQIDK